MNHEPQLRAVFADRVLSAEPNLWFQPIRDIRKYANGDTHTCPFRRADDVLIRLTQSRWRGHIIDCVYQQETKRVLHPCGPNGELVASTNPFQTVYGTRNLAVVCASHAASNGAPERRRHQKSSTHPSHQTIRASVRKIPRTKTRSNGNPNDNGKALPPQGAGQVAHHQRRP